MKRQTGLATLAVVSGILLVVALFSVAVVGSGFASMKKAQNYVADAKQRAKAQAGLDCAAALYEQKGVDPTAAGYSNAVFNDCEIAGVTISLESVGTNWQLMSASGYAASKAIIRPLGGTASAFKTSGGIVVDGGNAWIPAKGQLVETKDSVDYYQCTAIVAGGDITIDVGKSDAEFTSELAGNKEKCATGYSTHIPTHSDPITNAFEGDILHNQPNIDVFQDQFDVPKEQWETVKEGFEVKLTTGSAISASEAVTNCGANIKTHIDAGKKKIWVEGDCMLTGMSGAGSKESPPLVVIKNGVVGAHGVFTFNGSILQFTVDYPAQNIADSWGAYKKDDGTNHILCKDGAMSLLCAQLLTEFGDDVSKWGALPFFFNGSYESFGSYMVDVPDSSSIVRGAFKPGYIDDGGSPSPGSGSLKLVKGSFHDF
ncbi:hypothetical protein LRP49_24395 [Enterovibrio sp. ZSDZ35]|uniref:Flp pilus-assembly TadG-like N-terminal domain-containing protein n=1 Tax=Enterovibrio qingdaonensis TaxID=2899818 RepID=A0ABT5QTL6_9GAMM|nr:hypothetical protein [Enterovibrio sp. ZSDZ35]MDD1784322.1 hypothetical protein [Enterovibrio sp. ZSDZ35]